MNQNFLTFACPSCKNILAINTEYQGSSYKCANCSKYHPLIRESGTIVGLSSGIRNVEFHSSEKHENMQCLLQHIKRYVPLAEWGFMKSAEFFVNNSPQAQDYKLDKNGYPAIVYKSPKCQVFFMLGYSGSGRSYAAFVYYGRLHAPNDKAIMKWNNKDAYCWHRVEYMLSFLDGVSPGVASNHERKVWQELANDSEFLNSGTGSIQSPLRQHAAIWEKYGTIFFDLFDLNNNDLWLKYRQYRKECYDVHGWRAHLAPDIHDIC